MRKNTIFAAVLSVAFAGIIGASAFAEGTGTSTKDVYLKSVPDPVYSVDIAWGDFQFALTRESGTNNFSFKPIIKCAKYTEGFPGIIAWNGYFSDSSCSQAFSGDTLTNAYVWRGVPAIVAIDQTYGGRVKAEVSFTPTSNYSWVGSSFYGSYSLQDKTISYSNALTNGRLARSEMDGLMQGYLKLDATNVPQANMQANDKIGTVTLTISPDTD